MLYEICVPRTQERDPYAASGLVQSICDVFIPRCGAVQFSVENFENFARYFIRFPLIPIESNDPDTQFTHIPIEDVQEVVNRFYPQAQVRNSKRLFVKFEQPYNQRMLRFVRSKSPVGDYQPYLPIDALRGNDPLANIVKLLANIPNNDVASYGVFVYTTRITKVPVNQFRQIAVKGLLGILSGNDPWANHRQTQLERNLNDAKAYKESEGAYCVIPFIAYRSPNKQNLQSVDAFAQMIMQYPQEIPFARDFIRTDLILKKDDEDWADTAQSYYFCNDLAIRNKGTRYNDFDDVYFVTPRELATLWHLPDKSYPVDSINWFEEKLSREIPEELKQLTEGVILGYNFCAGLQEPIPHAVRLPVQNSVFHTLILGRVGTGKSRLMYRQAVGDIIAGRGVCVIDPHGSHDEGLVNWIMNEAVLANRIDDVIWIDFANVAINPPPINPLLSAANASLVASDFVATLARVYNDDDLINTRMGDWIKLALRTISIQPDATLSDVRRVLRDKAYRNFLVEKSNELSLLEDWEDFDKADRQENSISGILTRVRRLMERNETIAMVCHPRPIHYGRLLAEGKIILVAAGGAGSPLSHQERMAFSSILVSQIIDAAFAGQYKTPVTMYIDEARNFVNAPIDTVLRETRKFNLGLTLTSQGMSAMSPTLQDAIEETVGTLIGFEMSDADAKMFKPYAREVYTVEELQTQGRFKAAVSTRYDGKRLRAFELNTVPSKPLPDALPGDVVRRHAIENYTPMSYGEVLENYKKHHAPVPQLADELVPDDDHVKRTPTA